MSSSLARWRESRRTRRRLEELTETRERLLAELGDMTMDMHRRGTVRRDLLEQGAAEVRRLDGEIESLTRELEAGPQPAAELQAPDAAPEPDAPVRDAAAGTVAEPEPQAEVEQADPEVEQPQVEPEPERPEAQPEQPQAEPEPPEAQPGQPAAEPAEAKPEQPEAEPEAETEAEQPEPDQPATEGTEAADADVEARPSLRPRWRSPTFAAGVVVLVAVVFGALLYRDLSGDDQQLAEPVPPSAQAPGDGAEVRAWPRGRSGWTVSLDTAETEEQASAIARRGSSAGLDAGVLDADRFSNLDGGYFLAFAGVYENRRQALRAAREAQGRGFPDAFALSIEP